MVVHLLDVLLHFLDRQYCSQLAKISVFAMKQRICDETLEGLDYDVVFKDLVFLCVK